MANARSHGSTASTSRPPRRPLVTRWPIRSQRRTDRDLVGAPAVGYADRRIRGTYYEDPDDVLRYRNTLTRLHNLACNPEESQGILRRRLEEIS